MPVPVVVTFSVTRKVPLSGGVKLTVGLAGPVRVTDCPSGFVTCHRNVTVPRLAAAGIIEERLTVAPSLTGPATGCPPTCATM